MNASAPILAVEGLAVSFPGLRGERVRVVDDVSFEVGRGETVALVGESGSGKSVSATPPPKSTAGVHCSTART